MDPSCSSKGMWTRGYDFVLPAACSIKTARIAPIASFIDTRFSTSVLLRRRVERSTLNDNTANSVLLYEFPGENVQPINTIIPRNFPFEDQIGRSYQTEPPGKAGEFVIW